MTLVCNRIETFDLKQMLPPKSASPKLRPYGALQICLLLLLFFIIIHCMDMPPHRLAKVDAWRRKERQTIGLRVHGQERAKFVNRPIQCRTHANATLASTGVNAKIMRFRRAQIADLEALLQWPLQAPVIAIHGASVARTFVLPAQFHRDRHRWSPLNIAVLTVKLNARAMSCCSGANSTGVTTP